MVPSLQFKSSLQEKTQGIVINLYIPVATQWQRNKSGGFLDRGIEVVFIASGLHFNADNKMHIDIGPRTAVHRKTLLWDKGQFLFLFYKISMES